MMPGKRKKDILPGLVKRIGRYYLRDLALIFAGIVMVGAVALAVSGYRTGNRGRVYAVDAKAGRGGYQQDFQAGLMGVVNSVTDMEDYSRNVRQYNVTDDGSNVLAGFGGVDRQVIHRHRMEPGTRKASELGYYASLMVEDSRMSRDDYDTLLRVVEAEATGGDITSKMLVAGVVLNRVSDPRFPDTISEVVWQKIGGAAQFQPTQDGRIYNCEITETTVEAVDRVLAGENLSQGALFFLARNSSDEASTRWFDDSLVKLFEYGGHEYYTLKGNEQ